MATEPDTPDTSRLQEWLNLQTGRRLNRGDPMGRVIKNHLASLAWQTLTWTRWKAGRGPRCGDHWCYRPEDWPGEIVPGHVWARRGDGPDGGDNGRA